MFNWRELLEQINWDRRAIIILAMVCAGLTFLGFVAVRAFLGAGKSAQGPSVSDEEGYWLRQRLLAGIGKPKGWLTRLDEAFERLVLNTGLGLSVTQALAWLSLGALVLATGMFLVRSELWIVVLGFILGWLATFVAFLFYRSRYRWKIQEQLPDIIYSLARSTRAGLSLEKAIELIGQQPKLVLAAEFNRCKAEMELGLPVVVALQNLARRLGLFDFRALVSLIAIYQTTGGNLPTMLERFAVSTRERNQFRGYVKSATALGRLTAMGIGLVTPFILLIYAIYQPDYTIGFFQSAQGWALVALATGMELLGAIWLYRLLKIEY